VKRGVPVPAFIAILAALVLASCGGSGPSSTMASPMPTTTPGEDPLNIDALPPVSLDPAALTAVCAPEANQTDPDAGETQLFCYDAIVLGLRAIQTGTDQTIERVYVQRPVCAAVPCTVDELSVATVTGWSADGPLTTTLDSRLTTVTVPARDARAKWPLAGQPVAARVQRPVIAGAPRELQGRQAYPFCGRVETGSPEILTACFRTWVLLGQPVELLEVVHGTEGGAITWLFRYDGRGAITRYAGDAGGWQRQFGSMILGPGPDTWDFEGWSEGSVFP
jgi:hypothetical protein